jgi:O-antigen/teichoic acid export membrane protein
VATAAVAVSLAAPAIVALVAPGFDDAVAAVGPLAIGVTAYGLSTILDLPALFAGRRALLVRLPLLAAATNIVLCAALVPSAGAYGAALATAGAMALLAASYWWSCRDTDAAPYDLRAIAGTLGAAGVATLGVLVPVEGVERVVLLAACFAAYVAVVVAVGGVRRVDMRGLRRR